MKKEEILELPSITNLKSNLKRTHRIIISLHSNVIATETFFDNLKIKKEKIPPNIILSTEDRNYIYQLGIIALFTNFEYFMVDIIKDLMRLFPKSGDDNKLLSYSEISDIKSVDELKEYMIDMSATEKAYELEKWKNYLITKYGVELFQSPKIWNQVCIANEIRNCLMHADSKVNSKFISRMKKYIKVKIPINDDIRKVANEKYFTSIYRIFLSITE